MELTPVLSKENFLVALIGGRQRFFFGAMDAPKIELLIGNDDAVPCALHLHAKRRIIEMPPVEEINAPRQVVLSGDE